MSTIEIEPDGRVLTDGEPASPSGTPVDPGQIEDIRKFERMLGRYLSGDLEEDVFRVFRLANGVYGQRQGGHNQMVRVKAPYGAIGPDQLEAFAHIADEYSRGWGHLTTRQNVQFHYVQLGGCWLPGARRVGLTTREACSTRSKRDGLPRRAPAPTGARHQPWADATFWHFLRNPISSACASSDQLLRLRRLRPGDVQRRRGDRCQLRRARRAQRR